MDDVIKKKIHRVRAEIKKKYFRLKHGLMLRDEENQKSLSPITNLLKRQLDKMSEESNTVNNTIPSVRKKKKLRRNQFNKKLDTPSYENSDSDDDVNFKSILNSQISSTPFPKTHKSLDEIETDPGTPSVLNESLPISMDSSSPNLNDSKIEPFELFMNPVNDQWDKTNGPVRGLNGLILGDSTLSYNQSNILVNEQEFPNTVGLRELILKHKPAKEKITASDLEAYKQIINLSNLKITKNASFKYQKFIKPNLYKEGGLLENPLLLATQPSSIPVYKYWNNANELIDRLRILVASKSAGNNSLNNEIIAIIEELREEGIIA